MTYADTSYTSRDLRRWVSDLVLSVPLRGHADPIEIAILIEHKSHRSRLLPFQLLTYVATGYRRQIKQRKKVSVIIPVVYFHGKHPWQLPQLTDYFPGLPEIFLPYIPVMAAEMLSLAEMSDAEINGITNGMLRAALLVQKNLNQNIIAIEELAKVINTLSKHTERNFSHQLFVYIFYAGNFNPEELTTFTNLIAPDMRTKNASFIDLALEKMQENAMKRERREGILEGESKGREKSRIEFAKRLLQRNLPIDDIADLTGLPEEQVRNISAEM